MVSRLLSEMHVRSRLRIRVGWSSGSGSGIVLDCVVPLSSRVAGASVLEEDEEMEMLVGVVGEGSRNDTPTGGRKSRVLSASKAARRLARPDFALIALALT